MASHSYPFVKPIPPDLEGYLLKMKHKQSIFGSWVKRYFKVNADLETLDYFDSLNSSKRAGETPSKTFPLPEIVTVRKFDGNCIQVESRNGSLMLRTSSAAEQESWYSELHSYVELRRDYDRKVQSYEIEEREKMLREEYTYHHRKEFNHK